MARILIMSSWVARGHVGLCAAVPALNALGHNVTQLPTTLLSNHPGWPSSAGAPVAPNLLEAMIEALAENGWLADHDALLTGYLPSREHVELAARLVTRVRLAAPGIRVVVDPVMGDAPGGLYLPESVADALRGELCPHADLLTPNLFELGWLSGAHALNLPQATAAARRIRAQWGTGCIAVTSAPLGSDRTGVLTLDETRAELFSVPKLDGVPHGVGDVFSALIASGRPAGAALGQLQALIAHSLGADHLRIAETAELWTSAAPVPASPAPEEDAPWPSTSS